MAGSHGTGEGGKLQISPDGVLTPQNEKGGTPEEIRTPCVPLFP